MSEITTLIDMVRENTETLKELRSSIWTLESSLNGCRSAIDNLKTSLPPYSSSSYVYDVQTNLSRIRELLENITTSQWLQNLQTVLESQPAVIYKKI